MLVLEINFIVIIDVTGRESSFGSRVQINPPDGPSAPCRVIAI
jgi:hypothetical protein